MINEKYSGTITIATSMMSGKFKSSISFNFPALTVDASNFYITDKHRSAKAIISGGIPGESIKLTALSMTNGTGHDNTWRNKLSQTWTFNSKGQITLTDGCSFTGHTFTIQLRIEYRGQTKDITLTVNT